MATLAFSNFKFEVERFDQWQELFLAQQMKLT